MIEAVVVFRGAGKVGELALCVDLIWLGGLTSKV